MCAKIFTQGEGGKSGYETHPGRGIRVYIPQDPPMTEVMGSSNFKGCVKFAPLGLWGVGSPSVPMADYVKVKRVQSTVLPKFVDSFAVLLDGNTTGWRRVSYPKVFAYYTRTSGQIPIYQNKENSLLFLK